MGEALLPVVPVLLVEVLVPPVEVFVPLVPPLVPPFCAPVSAPLVPPWSPAGAPVGATFGAPLGPPLVRGLTDCFSATHCSATPVWVVGWW